MVREVASKTSDVAGDGTTTATVLAQAIYREGLKQVTAGHNPMEIKRGIDQAVDAVVKELQALSRDVKDKKEIAQVGGAAYLRSIQALDQLQLEGERQVGAAIVRRALEEPTRQIALNAGVEGATVVQRLKAESGAMGYDAATGAYVDLMEAGIIDPTKVSRTALQNAASVAGLLLTTEALVTEIPEKPKAAPAGMHDDMGDMDF